MSQLYLDRVSDGLRERRRPWSRRRARPSLGFAEDWPTILGRQSTSCQLYSSIAHLAGVYLLVKVPILIFVC
jgi:hypothetical protein